MQRANMFARQAADPDFSGSDDSDDSDFEADDDDEEEAEEGSEADATARSPFGGRAGWRCELLTPVSMSQQLLFMQKSQW